MEATHDHSFDPYRHLDSVDNGGTVLMTPAAVVVLAALVVLMCLLFGMC